MQSDPEAYEHYDNSQYDDYAQEPWHLHSPMRLIVRPTSTATKQHPIRTPTTIHNAVVTSPPKSAWGAWSQSPACSRGRPPYAGLGQGPCRLP